MTRYVCLFKEKEEKEEAKIFHLLQCNRIGEKTTEKKS